MTLRTSGPDPFSVAQSEPAPTSLPKAPEFSILPSVKELGAGFRQENPTLAMFNMWTDPQFEDNENYNVFQDDDLAGFEEFRGHFAKSGSRGETQFIKNKIQQELEDRQTLAGAGGMAGFLAYGAAGLFSVENFIPGLGLVGVAAKGGKLARIGKVALQGGAAAALAEVPLQGEQELRTAEESVTNVVAATAFVGVLGLGAHAIGSARHAALNKMSERIFKGLGDQLDDGVGIEALKASDGSISKWAAMSAEDQTNGFMAALEKYHPESSVLADGPAGVNWMFRAVSVLTRNPVMRMARSDIPEVRIAGMFMMNNPLLRVGQLTGEVRIQAVDVLVEQRWAIPQVLYRAQYAENLKKYGGPLGKDQLGKEMLDAVRTGVVSRDLDDVSAAFVRQNSDEFSSSIKVIQDEAVRTGVLSEFDVLDGYVTRIYNVPFIKDNPEKFLAFIKADLADKISDTAVLDNKAREILSSIMRRERGHHHLFGADRMGVAESARVKERELFIQAEGKIDDAQLSAAGFLVNDPEVVVQRLFRTLGPRIEMARRFGPMTSPALIRVVDRARRMEKSLQAGNDGKVPVTPEEISLLVQQVNDLTAVQVLSQHGFREEAARLAELSKSMESPGTSPGATRRARVELEGVVGQLRKDLEESLDSLETGSTPLIEALPKRLRSKLVSQPAPVAPVAGKPAVPLAATADGAVSAKVLADNPSATTADVITALDKAAQEFPKADPTRVRSAIGGEITALKAQRKSRENTATPVEGKVRARDAKKRADAQAQRETVESPENFPISGGLLQRGEKGMTFDDALGALERELAQTPTARPRESLQDIQALAIERARVSRRMLAQPTRLSSAERAVEGAEGAVLFTGELFGSRTKSLRADIALAKRQENMGLARALQDEVNELSAAFDAAKKKDKARLKTAKELVKEEKAALRATESPSTPKGTATRHVDDDVLATLVRAVQRDMDGKSLTPLQETVFLDFADVVDDIAAELGKSGKKGPRILRALRANKGAGRTLKRFEPTEGRLAAGDRRLVTLREAEEEAVAEFRVSDSEEAQGLRQKAIESDRGAGISKAAVEPPDSLAGDKVIKRETLLNELGKVRRALDSIMKAGARDAESMGSLFRLVEKRWDERIASLSGLKRKLAERKRASNLADMRKVRNRILGIRESTEEPSNLFARIPDWVRNLNYFRLGANFGLNSVPDTASHTAVSGFAPVGAAFKEWIGKGDLKLISRGRLQRYFIAAELVANSRAFQIADLTETLGGAMSKSTEVFAKATGLAYNNAYQAAFASLHVSHNVLDGVSRLVTGGTLSRVQRNALAVAGIDDAMAKRIHKTWLESIPDADRKQGSLLLAQSDNWKDARAREVFEVAVITDVRRAPITPGVGDRPRFMDEQYIGMVGQFRSFMFSTTTKMLLPGLQRGELGYLAGFTAAAGFGMLVTALRLLARGEELPDDPAWWVLNGMDRGGHLGVPGEISNIGERILGMGPFSMLTDDEGAKRFQTRRPIEALIGPAAGAMEDTNQALSSFVRLVTGADEEMTSSDRNAFLKLMPFQNAAIPPLPQLRRAFVGETEERRR